MTAPPPHPDATPHHPHPPGYPPAGPSSAAPPGGPPGYGLPPPYQGPAPQWTTSSPPGGGGGKVGWILGGIAAVVTALIIVVAGVVVVMRVGSGGDEAAGDGDTVPAAPNAYTPRENICVTLDISPVEDLAGTSHILHNEGYEMFSIQTWVCRYSMRNDEVWGELKLTIDVYPDVDGAQREFERAANTQLPNFGQIEDAPGSWQQGIIRAKDGSTDYVGSITILYQIQDSNLKVEARFNCILDVGVDLEPEMRATVEEVIGNVMAAHAV